MRLTYDIFQTNKNLFMKVHPKIARKLEFADNLWLPFFDQPQWDVVVFPIIQFSYIQHYSNKTET